MTPTPTWGRKRVVLLAGLILLTALVLHAPRMVFPMLRWDDFWFLRESWTWSAAWENLWRPINDHAMPLSRVTTWLSIQLSGCATALPYVFGLQGPLIVVVCMGLLYLFLRLLVSQNGLDRFLRSTSEKDLSTKLADVRTRLEAAKTAGDERVTNSLQDSVADAELRLENYRKAAKDAEFVAIELDRIETKIQALMEMGVSRQDPDYLSHQVTAAAESMQHTEAAVNELQHLTGLADQLEEPPAILESDLRGVLRHDA